VQGADGLDGCGQAVKAEGTGVPLAIGGEVERFGEGVGLDVERAVRR
jgi:hypothetical protein